jgi:hypothetical protein
MPFPTVQVLLETRFVNKTAGAAYLAKQYWLLPVQHLITSTVAGICSSFAC